MSIFIYSTQLTRLSDPRCEGVSILVLTWKQFSVRSIGPTPKVPKLVWQQFTNFPIRQYETNNGQSYREMVWHTVKLIAAHPARGKVTSQGVKKWSNH